MARCDYEMTGADLQGLLDAMKPVPYMIVGGMRPVSQQENANAAWKSLGDRMGFDHMTVRPTGKGDRFFSAEPLQPAREASRSPAPADGRGDQMLASASCPQEPVGWKLVPIEPTQAMIDHPKQDVGEATIRRSWAAMLAAAPPVGATPTPDLPSDVRADGDREAFEAWVNATPYSRCDLTRGSDRVFGTGYVNPKTALAWDAWKARSVLTAPDSSASQTGDA